MIPVSSVIPQPKIMLRKMCSGASRSRAPSRPALEQQPLDDLAQKDAGLRARVEPAVVRVRQTSSGRRSSIAFASFGGVGTSSLESWARHSRMSGTCCSNVTNDDLATSCLLARTCVRFLPPGRCELRCDRLGVGSREAL